ncbi:sensor histidine kinase [Alteribacillus bidgolensis]|uniref:Sensor histidine kinase n=1 Tax=Alteribacillus bidgolensis TaxID=930129 RepID=A0A1G8N537_9BACI|nr:sensor histidine kinase [Alteribacillus bidgolensis]SDI75196.1 two-component system, NarL family, sensor histidine kinase LiaS [Alteribacillus bidgolensis]
MRKMVNIQWDYIRYSFGTAVITAVLLFLILLSSTEDLLLLLTFKSWFGLPTLLIWVVVSFLLALLIGWRGGKRQKLRINKLLAGTLALEKGDFSKNIHIDGEDEFAVMGNHLNAVASRMEEQARSVQKLSAERAEWQASIKQSAAAAERQRLARELHDAVSQQLFAISMTTAALQKTIPNDIVKGKKQVSLIEKMAGNAQGEMRALLMHLRPASLEGKLLEDGLKNLLQELSEKTKLQIKWNIQEIPDAGKGIEDHLFRIAQEALSNVLRHAQAAQVDFQLKCYSGQLRMKIIDDGVGFHLERDQKQSSYGLSMMKERVNELGGVIHILSYPRKGTQIEVNVPIVDDKEEEKPIDKSSAD